MTVFRRPQRDLISLWIAFALVVPAFADLPIKRPTKEFLYKDAMYYYIADARKDKPWLDVAVQAYIREYKASGGNKESATMVFNALADFGTKREALHRSGSSWSEERDKDHEALKDEFFGTLKDYAGGGFGGGKTASYFKVGTDAFTLIAHSIEEQNKRRGPSDEMRWDTYSVDGESAKAYAEKRKKIADNFGHSRALGHRYTADGFMTATTDVDEEGLDTLGGLVETHSGFKNVHTIPEMRDTLTGWSQRMDASYGATVIEWLANEYDNDRKVFGAKFDEFGRRLGNVEIGVEQNNRLIRGAIAAVNGVRGEVAQARVEQEEGFRQTNENLGKLDKLLRDRFNEEDRRRILAEEREKAERLIRQKYEEKLGAFDSASNFFQQIGNAIPNKSVRTAMNKMSGLAQVAKKFESLRATQAVSGFGKAAMTMDWISLGLQVTSLALGFGGPSPEQMILEAIMDLTAEMHERFDRIEMTLGELQRSMDRHFEAVHEALQGIRDGQEDARYRLMALEDSVAMLTRKAEFYGSAMLEISSAQQWQTLNDQVSKYVTRRDYEFPDVVPLRDGLRTFVEHGVEHAVLPSLIGPANGFEGVMTINEALARLDGLPDVGQKLDSFLQLERSVFGLKVPGEGRIAEEEYWSKAANAFASLVEDNATSTMFPVDAKHRLEELSTTGENIRTALVEARKAERLETIVNSAAEIYRGALKQIDTFAASVAVRTSMGLPTTYYRQAKGPSLQALFNQSSSDQEDANKKKPALAEMVSPEKGFNPPIHFRRSDGKYVPLTGGTGIVPPVMIAIAHFGRQLHPSKLRKGYNIYVWVDKMTWKAWQRGHKNKYSYSPVIHLKFSIPELKTSQEVVFTSEALRQDWDSTFEPEPKPRTLTEVQNYDAHYWATQKRLWRNRLEAHLTAQSAHNRKVVTDMLADDWKNLVGAFIAENGYPWDLAFGSEAIVLSRVMAELQNGIREDLKQLITRKPGTPVVYGTAEARPDQNSVRLWYLDKATGLVVDKVVDDLRGAQEVLKRHLLHFAPDFLFAKAKDLDQWMDWMTWGTASLALAADDLLLSATPGKPSKIAASIDEDGWQSMLGGFRQLWTSSGSDLLESYRKYLASLPAEMQPQCVELDATLRRLENAAQKSDELITISSRSKAIAREQGIN